MKPIYFSKGIPSNFYSGAPIEVYLPQLDDLILFDTNEHYFQACKVWLCSSYDPKEQKKSFRRIAYAATSGSAKALGKAVPLTTYEIRHWDRHASIMAMLDCNLEKYHQHQHCREWLLHTKDRPLVEHRRDAIWGDNLDGTGQNRLGRILELVRATLQET